MSPDLVLDWNLPRWAKPYERNTVESLYSGHHCNPTSCPVYRSVPNSEADFNTVQEVPLYSVSKLFVMEELFVRMYECLIAWLYIYVYI